MSASALEAPEIQSLQRKRAVFARAAYAVLAFNFLVVAWGAYVRASGSGAGCGRHWPKCNGEILPAVKSAATFIEFAHRATSGLALLMVVGLWVASRALFPKGAKVRRFATLSALFMATEALLGAGLVLFEYVAKDASMKRAFSMSLHLCNTFCLLGCIAATAYVAHRKLEPSLRSGRLWPLLGMIPVGVSGAIAALGDTLFPATSLGEGLRADLGAGHIFLKLRTLHPALAVASSLLLLLFIAAAQRKSQPSQAPSLAPYRTSALAAPPSASQQARARLATWVRAGVIAQLLLGLVNVALLAPVPIQLMHLLLADAIFVATALYVLEAQSAV
jgi:heme a synthase